MVRTKQLIISSNILSIQVFKESDNKILSVTREAIIPSETLAEAAHPDVLKSRFQSPLATS